MSATKSWLSALILGLLGASTEPFSDETLLSVKKNMLNVSQKSWELGTATQALFEFDWPAVSVFSPTAFPVPTSLNSTFNVSNVLEIAKSVIDSKPSWSPTLVAYDDAAGDPPSIGVAIMFANWTRHDKNDTRYSDGATSQLDYILHNVPRTWNGAVSHRASEPQAWADFAYMVPPFIAYYGAVYSDWWLLNESYNQLKLYRDLLRTPSVGLWKHVVLGGWQDNNHWATGNAWAAAGMLRVQQTLNHSLISDAFESQQSDLLHWTHEILENSWKHQHQNGTLFNYIDQPNTFADTAGTALLAATTYRHAKITGDDSLIPFANKAYNLIRKSVDEDGWLRNTVDPITFSSPSSPSSTSPEGQAFVLMLHAAWGEYWEKKWQEFGGQDEVTKALFGGAQFPF